MGKRRAENLWVLGEEVTLDDGKGEPVAVFVRKLTPVDNGLALTRANAVRARVRAVKRKPDSDEYWAIRADVEEIPDKEAVVEYLLLRPRLRIESRVEAEQGAKPEWAADDYLTGLKDAWRGGLDETYAIDPTDVEALRVWEELKRFAAQVQERIDAELEVYRIALSQRDEEELREDAVDQMITDESENAWMNEFRNCQLFYGTRSAADPLERHFRDRRAFDNLSAEALRALRDTYDAIEVGPTEGKGSEGTPTSSTSSESPSDSATGVSSGLAAVGP